MSDAAIRSGITALLHTAVLPYPARRIEGGCINDCFRYETSTGAIFVKVAPAAALDRFEAEAAGLNELRSAKAIRVPQVLGVGLGEHHALLVLEWIKLSQSNSIAVKLGEQLAVQHRAIKPLFGWKRHNFIGSTPQVSFWSRSWVNFWREHRLEAQLNLAEQKGADDNVIERTALLSTLIDGFFVSYSPVASLLHGDLWNGNCAADATGTPVVFDPAVYYGDRECDLAMTRLFGGFSPEFYAAYDAAWPLENGWQHRTDLYNLYHVLNHFNLFGGSYLSQVGAMVERLLAELGH
jgi:fructosamine-3-kinase